MQYTSKFSGEEIDSILDNVAGKQDAIPDLETIRSNAKNASDTIARMVESGYLFAGIATIDTNPGTPDAKVFYIANGKGTYTNFGSLEVTEDEVVVLYWDTAWHKVATGIASQAKLSELVKNDAAQERIINGLKDQVNNYKPIEITGNVTNAADEEDITSENGLLKIKNRSSLNGMGYVILRKDKTFVEQVSKGNTIYEVRYDFDINNEEVKIPTDCVLYFNGGSIRNGSIVFSNTLLWGDYKFINIQSLSGDLINEIIDSSRIGFINDTLALYHLLHLGGISKLILENKEYNIDSRIINDSSFGSFAHLERNNLDIVGNGATIIDARGNAELLQANSYFYFLTFSNSNNIKISQLGYISNDPTIEIRVGSEMETFGLCFVAFTNSYGIDLLGLYGKNISVGVTINESIEGSESNPSSINGSFDNVGYMIMLNGAENIDISMNAKAVSHRCIYFGGARNIRAKVSFDNEITVSASGFLFQEFWKKFGQEDYIFQQCSNIKLIIDAFGSITGNSLIKLLRYDSTIHPIIEEKSTSYVMDGMDIQVNLYKGASVSVIFDSSLNKSYDHNILFRGKIVCNYFEDTKENDYPVYIACGSGSAYNNIDFDLDVYVNSQNHKQKSMRLTNLTKESFIRVNSNTPIALTAFSDIGATKGVGQLVLCGETFILGNRSEGATCNILVNRGNVDKSVYRSAVGYKEIRTTFTNFISGTNTDYETLLKYSTDIHLAIQESFTFNSSYDRIKNFLAKNEEHLLLVENTSSSDVTFGVGLFDIKNVDDSYTMSPNSTLLFRFGTINQLSYISKY